MHPEVYQKLYQRLVTKLLRWLETIVEMLPNTVVALLLLLAFWLFSVAAAALLKRALRRMNADAAASRLAVTLVRLTVLGAGLFGALDLLGLNTALTSLLAGAGILGLALSFAFQDLASNLISGVALSNRAQRPFQPGDLVETNGTLGVVEEVSLRTTTLTTLDGKHVVIPNRHIYQSILVNLSTKRRRRIELTFGVDRTADLVKIHEVTLAALESIEPRLTDPPPRVFLRKFTESSIELLCWIWVEFTGQEDLYGAENRMVLALHAAYRDAGIVLPFPVRSLEVRDKAGLAIRQP